MKKIFLHLLGIILIYNQITNSFAQQDDQDTEDKFNQGIDNQIKTLISSCDKFSENSPEIQKYRSCARGQLSGASSLASEVNELVGKNQNQLDSGAWLKLVPKICKPLSGMLKCMDPLKDTLTKCFGEGLIGLLKLETKLCENGGAKIIEFKDGVECFVENKNVFGGCFIASDVYRDLAKLKFSRELLDKNLCRIVSTFEDCTSQTLSKCSSQKPKKIFEEFMEELKDESSLIRTCKSSTNYKTEKNVHGQRNGGDTLKSTSIFSNLVVILLGTSLILSNL